MRHDAPRMPTFDMNTCPVSDVTLSRLYRAEPADIRAIAMELPELQRMQLAAFCYARSHLREVGREVALVCNMDKVVSVAGWNLTRIVALPEHVEQARVYRPRVTLASRKNTQEHLPWQVVHENGPEDDL